MNQEITKGDKIIYHFGHGLMDAKVVDDYGDHIKVRHNDGLLYLIMGMSYKHIIPKSKVLQVLK